MGVVSGVGPEVLYIRTEPGPHPCLTRLRADLRFTARFRRSAKSDVVSLGLLSVLGFSAASASTAAGYLELAQCAGYNSRCAMGTTGGVLNWITAAYVSHD